jgi:hypothetical protein
MTAGAAGLVLSRVGRSPGTGLRANPAVGAVIPRPGGSDPLFSISLAQWSLHRALDAGELENLDFPRAARRDFGIDAVEYVNVFFQDRARDQGYLLTLKDRCDAEGVKSLLIMCDGEGRIGDPDDNARTTAIANHYPWVEAARLLGCHSIRVNAASEGSWDEQRDLASDGLHRLAEFADGFGVNVIVENHGGLSSNGRWLSSVIEAGDHPRLGTLPDFGKDQRLRRVGPGSEPGLRGADPHRPRLGLPGVDRDRVRGRATVRARRDSSDESPARAGAGEADA